MEQKKLCLILNVAPHYRKGIFKLIDRTYDAYFVAGSENGDIKSLDMSNFRNKVVYTKDIKFNGRRIWQKGILKYAFKDFDTYLMSEDIYKVNHWIFLLLCKIMRKKVYSWTHGWYGKETKIKIIIKKIFFRLFSGVFLYGEWARELMIKEGFNSEKLWVIHNSLDYSYQLDIRNKDLKSSIYLDYFKNENPTLIFIGRLTKVKKLESILTVMKNLESKGLLTNLIFVGGGEEKEFLEKETQILGLQDRVWFYGSCYDDKINAKLIANADLCVAPGNVGLTAMHTMVFGTPVVTHNDFKWQMPEFEAIKQGNTGDFFEKDNIQSMTNIVYNWLINNKNRRDEIRNICYNEIDMYWNPQYQINVIKKIIH